MDRRNFMQLALAGSAASVLTPATAQAATLAGGVYYTRESPGRWASKAATHVPFVEVSSGKEGVAIKVITSHEMKGYEHYIVKHVVLDKNYQFIAEKMFDPTKDSAAISSFNLGQYKGTIYVLSMCNKHDLWLASAEV
jgi:superoxide reductase